jgi:hypothetical protein
MLFSIRVLEFWVMETTNIYDFLHLLSVIKIKPNMNFGGDLAFANICHNTFFFSLFLSREWRKAYKQIPNQEVRDTPWLLFICLLHLVFSN